MAVKGELVWEGHFFRGVKPYGKGAALGLKWSAQSSVRRLGSPKPAQGIAFGAIREVRITFMKTFSSDSRWLR